MQSYADQAAMQKFIVDENENASEEKKIFLAKIMASLNAQKLPEIWTNLIGKELNSEKNTELKSALITILKSRNITGFEKELEVISSNTNFPTNLRIKALSLSKGGIASPQFQFLKNQISEKAEATTRQMALNVLANKVQTDSQLASIATDVLPTADALTMPQLLPYFKNTNNPEIGNQLYSKLLNFKGLDNLNESLISEIFDNFGNSFIAKKYAILAKITKLKADRIDYLKDLEKIASTGDIEKGRKIFYGKAMCSTCHSVGKEGGKFGPDLTSIQRDRSIHDLLEAIAYPSVSFVRLYETYEIETTNGTFTGIIKEQSPTLILLENAPNSVIRIVKKDVKNIKNSEVSMMPQGLEKILSKEELADLMTFILGQDQNPEFDSNLLRLRNQKH